MRLATTWTFVAIIVVGLPITELEAEQAAADGVGQIIEIPSTASGWAPNRTNPYRGLFPPIGPLTAPRPDASSAAPSPKPVVKCGMTLIPGDPRIDPRIAAPPPASATQFTVRGVDPPVCR